MAEDPLVLEQLPQNLQTSLDKKLTANEAVLISLTGAHGEGFVATDKRVFILREQMPIVGVETEVDCFDYTYDQIKNVIVEGAVGGGHLKMDLLVPPDDLKQTSLFFPAYFLTKFDAGAARVRLIAQQTRPIMIGADAAPVAEVRSCRSCTFPLSDSSWVYCPSCGVALSGLCAYCLSPLPKEAKFCPGCGSVAEAIENQLCECGAICSPMLHYCGDCGRRLGNRCGRCGARLLSQWQRCANCGERVAQSLIATIPREWEKENQETSAPLPAAEEHNKAGMLHYNNEQYLEAITEFKAALELDPANSVFCCNAASAFAEAGQDDEALVYYGRAISLAPTDPTAYLNLGYYYSEREQFAEARMNWERAKAVAPDSSEAEEAAQNLAHMDEV